MIRMLHTADWHIDAPLREFTDLQRRELRASLLELPGKIADLCAREGCDLVLLCGDVFDGPYTREGYEAVYRALERMAVPVFITPGNHDPYGENSVWAREIWPDNVYLFRKNELTTYTVEELDCCVYGAAFTSHECPPLLPGFHADCEERHAILMLHGDPVNPASPYNPVTAAQLRDVGVDYTALGHIHAQGSFSAGAGICAWPGCPMGRGFDEAGEKGVIIAELDETVSARFVPLDTPRFFDLEVQLDGDPRQALAAVLPAVGNDHFYRVTLTGSCPGLDIRALDNSFPLFANLELRDRTQAHRDPWESAGEDTLEGVFFRKLRETRIHAGEDDRRRIDMAAKLARTLLDGQEVTLP